MLLETAPERATRHAHITSPFHRVHTLLLGETFWVGIRPTEKRSRCSHQIRDVSLADSRIALERETRCQNRAGTSREWDFDGNVELGVVGLHLPRAVLASELLGDLADLRLVGEKTGARGERVPTGLQADGRCLAQVFVPVGI